MNSTGKQLEKRSVNYLDFELLIGTGSEKWRKYPVIVTDSPAGEAHEYMEFPFTDQELDDQLSALEDALLHSGSRFRRIISHEEKTVQDFGRTLFDALLSKEVRSRYDVSQDRAFHQNKGLRIKLHIQSPKLASLPWEFLYDKRLDKYICLSNNTPIIRYLELPKPTQPLSVSLPVSILGMVANPVNLASLNVEHEQQRLEKSLEVLRKRGLVQLTWIQGHTWRDLQREMRSSGPSWHVFHFIGHGGFDPDNDEGVICLENDEGKAHNFTATQLARLLSDHQSLRLIVLNSCDGAKGSTHDIFSSTAATLVQQSVSAVLAMQYPITDTAAIELSRTFYEVLAEGSPVDMAVAEARKAISMAETGTLEWGTPVLYMRSPNGELFTLNHNRTKGAHQEPVRHTPPIEEQIAFWIQEKAVHIRTKEAYEQGINKFRNLLKVHGLDLTSEDDSAISALLQKWATQGLIRGSVSNNTFNQRRAIINSFYSVALEQHWRQSNPIDMIKPRGKQLVNDASPLDPETVRHGLKLINRSTPEGKRDYALLCILLTTGGRVTEISDLRCSDVTRTSSHLALTTRQKGSKAMYYQLQKGSSQALLDYLTTVYRDDWPSDAPLWKSFSRNESKGLAIGTQAIAAVCRKYLGTTKVEATNKTYKAMVKERGIRGIEQWLDIV